MPDSPVITSILTVAGLGTTGGAFRSSTKAQSPLHKTLLVGLVLDEKRVAWGTCVAPKHGGLTEEPEPFDVNEGINTIQNSVVPILEGRRVSSFRKLAAKIDALSEIRTITRVLPLAAPAPEASSDNSEAHRPATPQISRRKLLRGQFWQQSSEDEAEPIVEQFTAERPISPAIRYGLSQALLAAKAMAHNVTMAEVILAEYGLPRPASIVPIHTVIKAGEPASLERPIASLGYLAAGLDPGTELGGDGQKLQRFTRQLGQRISAAAGEEGGPTIHLNVSGGLGQLYDNNSGKILGALYGLQQAAGPHLVRIEDPLIAGSRSEQIEMMSELGDYLRLRGMSLQLAAGRWLDHLKDIRAFIEAEAAHMIHLEMSRLGGLDKTIEAVMLCKERGIGLLLDGAPAEVAAQVALATQPNLVSAPDDARVHNEMARTLAWLNRSPYIGGSS